jgi:hypothetical protein
MNLLKYPGKIVPKFIKRGILALLRQISEPVPRRDLRIEHVEHAKILPDRIELLHRLPKNGVVAELGVDEGSFSESILRICTPRKLHLVDAWETKRYSEQKMHSVERKFSREIGDSTVAVHRGFSTDLADEFGDGYFDWIYIDTDHSFKTTRAELEAYRTKVKEGGIIGGHDYAPGNWDAMVRYGVIEAVYDFCVTQDWELIFITAEANGYPSFAIRKRRT